MDKIIIIIGVVIAIAIGAYFLLNQNASASGTSNNPVPTLDDLLKQGALGVPTSGSTLGLTGQTDAVPIDFQKSLDDIKSALLSNSRTTQDALKAIANQNLGLNPDGTPQQTNIAPNGAGQAQTKQLQSIPTATGQLITLIPLSKGVGLTAYAEQQNLTTTLGHTPTLEEVKSFAGVRGKPLAPTATVIKTNNVVGTLTTPVGGTRQISGSPALFKRLQTNLLDYLSKNK